jgi:hypothetical protein
MGGQSTSPCSSSLRVVLTRWIQVPRLLLLAEPLLLEPPQQVELVPPVLLPPELLPPVPLPLVLRPVPRLDLP